MTPSSRDDFSGPHVPSGGAQDGPLPILSLSPSGISTLLSCPEKYRQGYILGKWAPGNHNTVLGNAYHGALQANYERKLWTGEDLDTEHLAEAYRHAWDKAYGGDVRWNVKAEPGDVFALGLGMAFQYARTVACEVTPIGVEERFSLMAHPAWEGPLIGRVDVRAEGNVVIDTKTSGKRLYEPSPSWRIQALCYLAAFPEYSYAWHVHDKTTGQIDTPETNPKFLLRNSRGRHEAAIRLVAHAWAILRDSWELNGPDEPWPGNGLAGYSCPNCDYRGKCFWWL